MSISQNGTTFSGDATLIKAVGPYEVEIITAKFNGVRGESHIIGKPGGRELFCEYRLKGYSTPATLQAAIESLQDATTELTGTLTQTIGGNTTTYGPSTFLGFTETGDRRHDPILGGGGYTVEGILRWRERQQP